MRQLLTALAMTASLCMMAQNTDMDDNDKKSPEDRAKHRTEMMTKELGLSQDQVARVSVINLTYAKAMVDVKKMDEGDARKARTKALRDNRDNQLKAVLTADQFTKMAELHDKKHEDKKDKKDKDSKKPHNE